MYKIICVSVTNMSTQQADLHARYFVAKCGGIDSLRRCVASKTWASRERVLPPQPDETLTTALNQGPVILLFSVNNCHGWHGYCHMMSPPKHSVTGAALVVEEELVRHQQQNLGEDLDAESACASAAELMKGRDSESDVVTTASGGDVEKTAEEEAGDSNSARFDSSVFAAKISSDCPEKATTLNELEQFSPVSTYHIKSVMNKDVPATPSEKINSPTQILSQIHNINPSGKISANNQNPSYDSKPSSDTRTSTWHYFEVQWRTEFISSFGEKCLPSSKTAHLLLPDGSPLNKARNWQEVSADVGAEVCALVDEMYFSLVEKRRKQEEAKLAAKPLPFIQAEGDLDVQEDSEQYWRCIVEKVERELGCVHLACPFGSQRSVSLPQEVD